MSVEITKTAAVGQTADELLAPARRPWYRALGLKGESFGTVVAIIAILLFWQFGGAYLPTYIFPTIPIAIERFQEVMLLEGTLPRDHADPDFGFLGGFAVSAVFGIAVGVVMAMSNTVQFFARPFIRLIMGVPALTLGSPRRAVVPQHGAARLVLHVHHHLPRSRP